MIIKELEVKYKSSVNAKDLKSIDCPEKVWKVMLPHIIGASQESFYVLCLNNKNRLHGWIEIAKGTVSETAIHPREIFKAAILMNSSSIICVHNHPSGELTPSKDDINASKRIIEAGRIIGIELLDHVIVSDVSFLSMKESGYM